MKRKFYNLVLYCNKETLQSVLDKKQQYIDYYAYIEHDRDVYSSDIIDEETGEIKHNKGDVKVKHIHLVMKLFTWRNVKEVKRWFYFIDEKGEAASVLYRDAKGTEADCLTYLTHENAPDKVQYDKDEVISFNVKWDEMFKYTDADAPVDNTYDIMHDMIHGENLMVMIKKYGRDFVYHYSSFACLKQEIIESELGYNYDEEEFYKKHEQRKIDKLETDTGLTYVSDDNVFD